MRSNVDKAQLERDYPEFTPTELARGCFYPGIKKRIPDFNFSRFEKDAEQHGASVNPSDSASPVTAGAKSCYARNGPDPARIGPIKVLAGPHPTLTSVAAKISSEIPLSGIGFPERFRLNLSPVLLKRHRLSSQQLETVSLACLQHTNPNPQENGFLIGEGTGCGKGRMIAACILHHWNLNRRRHIWFSVNKQLAEDARRDLTDLFVITDPHMDLSSMNLQERYKLPSGVKPSGQIRVWGSAKELENFVKKNDKKLKSSSSDMNQNLVECSFSHEKYDGVLFLTYGKLSHSTISDAGDGNFKAAHREECSDVSGIDSDSNEVIEINSNFGSSSVLQNVNQNLKNQKNANTNNLTDLSWIWKWFNSGDYSSEGKLNGRGVIAFDEGHKAKNLVAKLNKYGEMSKETTKTAALVYDIQVDKCPYASVVYASATAASIPANYGYMMRLGLWNSGAYGLTADGSSLQRRRIDPVEALRDFWQSHNLASNRDKPANFLEFETQVFEGGMQAMENVAVELRQKGKLSCRNLTLDGVECEISKIPLSDTFGKTLEKINQLLRKILEILDDAMSVKYDNNKRIGDWPETFDKYWALSTYKHIKDVKSKNVNSEGRKSEEVMLTRRYWYSLFFAAQQRISRSFLLCCKLDAIKQEWRAARNENQQVVISLSETSEDLCERAFDSQNFAGRQPERELIRFMLQKKYGKAHDDVFKGFHGEWNRENGKWLSHTANADNSSASNFGGGSFTSSSPSLVVTSVLEHAIWELIVHHVLDERKRDELLRDYFQPLLGVLPGNPLDELIWSCGGTAEVAEISGRSMRYTSQTNRTLISRAYTTEDRQLFSNIQDNVGSCNAADTAAFQSGRKHTAIITEAGSTGISLHADPRGNTIYEQEHCKRVDFDQIRRENREGLFDSHQIRNRLRSSPNNSENETSTTKLPPFENHSLSCEKMSYKKNKMFHVDKKKRPLVTLFWNPVEQKPYLKGTHSYGHKELTSPLLFSKEHEVDVRIAFGVSTGSSSSSNPQQDNVTIFSRKSLQRFAFNIRADDTELLQFARKCEQAGFQVIKNGRVPAENIVGSGPQHGRLESFSSSSGSKVARRRCMITAQFPWGGDKAVQQLGRVHRSNQGSAPRYVIPVLDLPGEKRFLGAVVKRMKTLGAAVKGNKKEYVSHGFSDLEDFDCHDKNINAAWDCFLHDVQTFCPTVERKKKIYRTADIASWWDKESLRLDFRQEMRRIHFESFAQVKNTTTSAENTNGEASFDTFSAQASGGTGIGRSDQQQNLAPRSSHSQLRVEFTEEIELSPVLNKFLNRIQILELSVQLRAETLFFSIWKFIKEKGGEVTVNGETDVHNLENQIVENEPSTPRTPDRPPLRRTPIRFPRTPLSTVPETNALDLNMNNIDKNLPGPRRTSILAPKKTKSEYIFLNSNREPVKLREDAATFDGCNGKEKRCFVARFALEEDFESAANDQNGSDLVKRIIIRDMREAKLPMSKTNSSRPIETLGPLWEQRQSRKCPFKI